MQSADEGSAGERGWSYTARHVARRVADGRGAPHFGRRRRGYATRVLRARGFAADRAGGVRGADRGKMTRRIARRTDAIRGRGICRRAGMALHSAACSRSSCRRERCAAFWQAANRTSNGTVLHGTVLHSGGRRRSNGGGHRRAPSWRTVTKSRCAHGVSAWGGSWHHAPTSGYPSTPDLVLAK
jgi:hypothetical protein